MSVTGTIDARRAVDGLRAVAPSVSKNVAEAVVRLSTQLVLNARARAADMFGGTGKLENHIVGGVTASDTMLTGWARTASDAATYLEAGFSGEEEVKAFVRRMTDVFGRPVNGVDAGVGQFGRSEDYPAHSFLRSALDDMAPQIHDDLQAAAVDGAKGAFS